MIGASFFLLEISGCGEPSAQVSIVQARPGLLRVAPEPTLDAGGPGSGCSRAFPIWSGLPARPSYISGHVLVDFAYPSRPSRLH